MRLQFLVFPAALFLLSACKDPQKTKEAIKIERNGVEISYTSRGDKDTTLLFLHGLCINKEYWEPQVKYFCNRYKVVTIDLPGFGKSGKNRNDWNFDEYAADVKAVIDQLKLKNVILIGHSMSGDIVLNVGNKYPEAVIGLVGIDNLREPGSPMNEEQRNSTDSFFLSLSTNFDTTVSMMRPLLFQPSTPATIVNRVMNDVYTSDSVVAIKVFKALTDISQKEQQLMRELPHRLYLIDSDVVPVKLDSLNKYCKYGCELMPVHATGHYPMIEKPGEFNSALEKVLAKISHEKSK